VGEPAAEAISTVAVEHQRLALTVELKNGGDCPHGLTAPEAISAAGNVARITDDQRAGEGQPRGREHVGSLRDPGPGWRAIRVGRMGVRIHRRLLEQGAGFVTPASTRREAC
jgi:hypothetical protein